MRHALVAIPVLNEASRIERVLVQLRRGVPGGLTVRFVVVDGGSADDTRAIVMRLAASDARIELRDNSARLQSAAINLAAAMCTADEHFLIRADAHTDYPDGFVARVIDAIECNGADALVVPMDSRGTTCVGRATAWVSDTVVGSGGSAHRGGRRSRFVDHGHHAGWRTARFQAVGGYDAGYSHNEDAELDCRLRRAGAPIWLDAENRLTYFVRPTLGSLYRQYLNYGRGRSRTMRRHPESMRLRQVAVPVAIGGIGIGILGGVFVHVWAFAMPGSYVAMLGLASLQATLRHRSACGLLAGIAAATMHIGWSVGFVTGLVNIREPRWVPLDAHRL